MNLPHSYAAPKPKNYVGVGFVIAVHVAAIYALSVGLIKTPLTQPGPISVKPLPDVVEPPPPPIDRVKPDLPTFKDVPVIQVPTPDIVIERDTTPLVTARAVSDEPQVVADRGPVKEAQPQAPTTSRQQPAVQSPGAVCSVMPKPEVPAVNWAGEAVLNVVATVRGGRVVGTDFRVAQGALDGKTRRSLQRSVESALAGYQCQGDAMFQQDFAFRID